ncbi:hypothetical protein [Halosimplex pelagicum]|uniref:Uncharacterized protein n=1 Tax=Halosimplex pelagicum TaxID=869886 RepID=A0A7D5PAF1_9EURY|nr:hypothetical protein [Halosimplex pelagicum]QLH83361.1 hypothetical protein HZS54_17745 [Halosimplex pelagicum]
MSTASNSEPVDPPTPESIEELESLDYSEKQSLAADHDYGRIVGTTQEELEEFLTDALDLAEPAEQSETRERAGDSDEQDDSEPEPDSDRDTVSNSTTESASTGETDAIEVGHEGSEKLSPEDAPDDDGTAVEPPDELDMDGISPDDLEPDTDTGPSPSPEKSETPSETAERQEDGDGSDGLLSRIKGDESKSSEEVVEDAETEAERERRREVKDQLSGSMSGGEQGSDDPAPTGSTQQAAGMVVDESVVGHLIAMPFNTAAAATDSDAWELTAQERQANAELFIAMCDERGIDVSETTMFALSMAGTFSSKAIQYRRETSDESDEPADPGPSGEPDPGGSQEQVSSDDQSESGQSGEIDFEDSSTWP